MGQIGRTSGLAAAGLIGACLALSGCGTSLSGATTTLGRATNVTIVTPDGSHSAGASGEKIAPGDQVETGAHGAATVVTQDRVVYLLAKSTVSVASGVHQSVLRGSALVDAARGDGESVALDGYSVAVPAGTAVRLDSGVEMRVATFTGTAVVTSPAGAVLRVQRLYQTQLGGDALATTTTALHLSDDWAESAAAPMLVRDDVQLDDLARGINGTGATASHDVDASFTAAHRAATRGTARSDRVLSVVLARAAAGSAARDYAQATRWRAQGGSWGVIAALLHVDASSAATELSSLEQQSGGIGHVNSAALVGRVAGGGHGHHGNAGSQPTIGGGQSQRGGSTPRHHSTGGHATKGNQGHPDSHSKSGRGSKPSPKPSPSGGVVGGVVTHVHSTLHHVVKRLPVVKKLTGQAKAGKTSGGVKAKVGPVHVHLH